MAFGSICCEGGLVIVLNDGQDLKWGDLTGGGALIFGTLTAGGTAPVLNDYLKQFASSFLDYLVCWKPVGWEAGEFAGAVTDPCSCDFVAKNGRFLADLLRCSGHIDRCIEGYGDRPLRCVQVDVDRQR